MKKIISLFLIIGIIIHWVLWISSVNAIDTWSWSVQEDFVYTWEKYEDYKPWFSLENVAQWELIFSEDFESWVIDPVKFPVNYKSYIVEWKYLESYQYDTDKDSTIDTQLINFWDNWVTLDYDFKSIPNNNHFYGNVAIALVENNNENYIYWVNHLYNEVNSIKGDYKDWNTWWEVAKIPGIHNAWVHHNIKFDIVNNEIIHTINWIEYKKSTNLSYLKNKDFKITINPYARRWWSKVQTDNIKVYKNVSTPSTSEPVSTIPWLVASYDLNWDAQDSSGNGNHGTASNVTYETLSNGNKVAVFNGANSSISINNNTNLWITWDITLSTLVKWDGKNPWWTNDFWVLFTKHDQNNLEYEVLLNKHNGSINFYRWAENIFHSIWKIDTNWNHLIITHNSSQNIYKIYQNWELIYSWASNVLWTLSNGWVNIWSSKIRWGWSYYFNWLMTQQKIYNKALTQQEINTLYQEWQEYLGLNTPVVEIPNAPSNFLADNITSDSVSYTWSDNSVDWKQEDKFVIKDENDVIIKDNISADSTNIWESGLQASTEYQRKICAVNSAWEACSEIINFTTQIKVIEWKTTPFDFMGIVINVIETAEMFKVEFIIWGFKINFSIEKIM